MIRASTPAKATLLLLDDPKIYKYGVVLVEQDLYSNLITFLSII